MASEIVKRSRPRCLYISVVSADALDVVFESGMQRVFRRKTQVRFQTRGIHRRVCMAGVHLRCGDHGFGQELPQYLREITHATSLGTNVVQMVRQMMDG